MSSKLQQLGIDRWPVADRLALLYELSASLPERGGRVENPLRRDALRRGATDDDDGRPWADSFTDIGGEG